MPIQAYLQPKARFQAKDNHRHDFEAEEAKLEIRGEDQIIEMPEERGLGMQYLSPRYELNVDHFRENSSAFALLDLLMTPSPATTPL